LADDPLPLGRAHLLASTAIREARRAAVAIDTMMAVGEVRRFEPAVGAVEVLGIAPPSEHGAILSAFTRLPMAMGARHVSDRSVMINTDRGILTLHLSAPDEAGAALVWHTGSPAHVAALRERADARELRFDEAQLADREGRAVRCPSEDDLYDRLDLPFIPPELRAGTGEIELAERNALPTLVLERHIRGDLHTHTSWSDGRDSTETMVLAARQLGYDYIAITDHSQRAWSSRRLAVEEIPRQREEIEALRRRISGIDILHGIEVDIMRDGTLDFDDQVLEGFDIVLASLHDAGEQEGPELTERYLKAIHHPLVNVITHPANRSPARSPGFDVDFEAMFDTAAATGTAMEIDGAPGHLDMDGELARRAAAAGVTIAIDSDCHRAEWLARQMRFGVGTARRGWIEPQHVLNAGSIDDVRAFVARKRSRRA
jgi:DNA polymerase (family 10)